MGAIGDRPARPRSSLQIQVRTWWAGRRPRAAFGFWAGSYFVGYGLYAIAAVWGLISPSPESASGDSAGGDSTFFLVLLFIVGVLLSAAAVSWAGGLAGLREWGWGRGRARLTVTFAVLGWILLAEQVQIVLDLLFDLPNANGPQPATFGFSEVLRSVLAGIGEELVVVAAPVVVLRRLRPGWLRSPRGLVAVVACLSVLRMLYHLYYGWDAVGLVPWAVTSVVVYLAWGKVWPMIVQHVAYDLLSFAASGGDLPENSIVPIELAATALFLILAWITRRRVGG